MELRVIGLKDTAYMARKRKAVEGLEKILDKENKYQELKGKQEEKKKTYKKLNYKTKSGQPLMRTQIGFLLGKIKKGTGLYDK